MYLEHTRVEHKGFTEAMLEGQITGWREMEKPDISTSLSAGTPTPYQAMVTFSKGDITNPNHSLGMLLYGDLAHALVCLVSSMEQTMSGA